MRNELAKLKLMQISSEGIYLHGSSVLSSNGALLFIGHSGAGKSTISQILSRQYPLIADDKVLAYRKTNGIWYIRGVVDGFNVYKSSKSMLKSSEYPLYAIIRIFKNERFKFSPISEKEASRYLVDAIFENDFQMKCEDLNIKKVWFKITTEISKNVCGWRLTFPKDKTIIKKIEFALIERGKQSLEVRKHEKKQV